MTRDELLRSAKPILFNQEMVAALQNGRKTQTRRLCADPAGKPPYHAGDTLYVRETWADVGWDSPEYVYKASDEWIEERSLIKWRPSIHMPKAAARLFLRVTSVTPQRLQDITGAECVAEGIPPESLIEVGEEFTRGQFADLWDSTVPKGKLAVSGWGANPWVWVIKFMREVPDEER